MKRVFAFIGFSVAITLLLLNTLSYTFAKFILLLVVVLFIASLLIKKLRQGKVAPIVLGSAIFACLIFVILMQGNVMPQKELDGQTAYANFKIIDIESSDESGYTYIVKTSSIELPNTVQNIKLKIKTNDKIYADYCEDINGLLSFYSFTDSGIDSYGDYGKNIFIRANLVSYEGSGVVNKSINYYLIKLRLYIADILQDNLSSDKAGLALSIFTGDKRLLSDDISDSFKICGLSHMTAVSGLHVTVICLCIYYLLKYLNINNKIRTLISLIVLLLYLGIADFSKSVIRASIMFTIMLIAKLINNKADSLNSLGIAVFVICLNPFAVTDASAVLTVLAILGLIVVKPAYDKTLKPKNKILSYFYDALFVSISVLLTTLPAIWIFFGKVSLISLVLNIFCIPILQVALVSVLLLTLFSKVSVLAFVPKIVSSFCLGALIKIADFASNNLNFLYVDVSNNLFGMIIAGIILIVAVSVIISGNVNIKIVSAFMVVMFTIAGLLSYYTYATTAYLTVTSNGAVIIYDKDAIILIDVDNRNECYDVKEIASSRNFKTALAVNSSEFEESISNTLPNVSYVSFGSSESIICEHIGVSYSNDVYTVILYDKVFKISDDYVTMSNGYKAYRDVYDRFSSTDDVTFSVARGTEVQII
jgi:competence protein ComEC